MILLLVSNRRELSPSCCAGAVGFFVQHRRCRTWTENEDNALIDLVQAEGSRESDWADKSGRFLGGGVRSKYALRKRWSDLKRKNRDSVGSARKKFSRKTHTFDVVGGRGWVKK